ncbi:MAG: DUF6240 domain-containing protein [Lachnospiraceae bacterium]
MNIADAFSAYGIKQKEQNTNQAGMTTVSGNINASQTGKTGFAAEVEAALYTEKKEVEQKQTSDLYSKNINTKDENGQETETEKSTEAEKNQERLNNVAERMTEDDMRTLADEGFPIEEMTAEQLEAAMERIKLQKELAANAAEHQAEQIVNEREAIIRQAVQALPGNPRAEQIAEKLIKANLPVTQGNLEKIAAAMEKAEGGVKLSATEAEYMVRNKLAPTLENVATAKKQAQTYQKKEHPLTEEAWKQLEPTVTHLLFQAGLRAGKEMIGAAQTFIKKDIPLTVENLRAYSQLMGIKLSEEDVLTKAVDAISIGQEPKNANLLSSTAKEVRQIIGKTAKVTDRAVDLAAAKESAANPQVSGDKLELSLANLTEAQEQLDSGASDIAGYLRDFETSGVAQAASIKARRQLEEIRAKMTYEAGYRLAKEGIRIDTVSMTKLIDNLRALENRFYSSFFTQAGVASGKGEWELLRDTTKKLNEIKEMPATLIVDTVDKGSAITLNELHRTGQNMDTTFRKFNETYEAVMTSPKAELGDKLTKAFGNVDSLLSDIGMETTDANRRAVRMLGYNTVEVTADNVERVREYDEKLQNVFKELHPAVTVRLIRDGVNPLEESIDSLTQKIADIRQQEGVQGEDNYSTFLVNLEKQDGISEEERKAYIAIYRALHQVEGAEEAAVGGVLKTGQELTLGNLLTAVRSGRAQGMDRVIDEAFGSLGAFSSDKDRIEKQIQSGIANKIGKDVEALNNLVEKVDNKIKELSTDTTETAKEEILRVQELAEKSMNPTRFLEDFNILTTVENLEAAKDLLNDDMTIFREWKRFKSLASGEEAVLPDFTEALENKETMQAAYQSFLEETKEIKNILHHDPVMTKYDVKSIKKVDVGARFMNRLSKREFYQIPVDTGNDIVNMNVTILQKGEERAKVMAEIPTKNLGKISAEATIQDNKLKCFITSDTREGTQALKERQFNLFAVLAESRLTIGSLFYGTEEVPVDTYAYRTDGIYKDAQGSEDTQEASDSTTLYRIAKALVIHVRNADEMEEPA